MGLPSPQACRLPLAECPKPDGLKAGLPHQKASLRHQAASEHGPDEGNSNLNAPD